MCSCASFSGKLVTKIIENLAKNSPNLSQISVCMKIHRFEAIGFPSRPDSWALENASDLCCVEEGLLIFKAAGLPESLLWVAGVPSSTSNMVKRCKNLHHILRIIHTCEKEVCTEPGGFLFFTRPSCCKVATPLSRSQTFRKCVKNSPPTMYLKQLNMCDNTTLTRQWLSDHKCDLVLSNVMFGVFSCVVNRRKNMSHVR